MYEFSCAAFCIFQLYSETKFLFRLVESLGHPGGCGASWIAASRPGKLSAGAQGCTTKPNYTILGQWVLWNRLYPSPPLVLLVMNSSRWTYEFMVRIFYRLLCL